MLSPLVDPIPFESIALLLQGGGALGAYQGGVYQALLEIGLAPDWVAGISIGAINAAIIAGNPIDQRVEKLQGFWRALTTNAYWDDITQAMSHYTQGDTAGDTARSSLNQMSAGMAMSVGVPGFFKPHLFPPFAYPPGAAEATSFYDVSPLRDTLLRFIDFDYLNSSGVRLTVGAVNIRNGNMVRFDSKTQKIAPEHIMASGALPPGFPPIEIDGEHYWDGGLISNTPLEWLIDDEAQHNTLAFQVDLWSADGELPKTMVDVVTRQKEIQYSSRTRASTDRFKNAQKLRHAFAALTAELSDTARATADYKLLAAAANRKLYNIVHLIYRSKHYEGHSKDYEFSRQSMDDHWQAGYHDTAQVQDHPEIFSLPDAEEGVATFDLTK